MEERATEYGARVCLRHIGDGSATAREKSYLFFCSLRDGSLRPPTHQVPHSAPTFPGVLVRPSTVTAEKSPHEPQGGNLQKRNIIKPSSVFYRRERQSVGGRRARRRERKYLTRTGVVVLLPRLAICSGRSCESKGEGKRKRHKEK